ncbi:MAG: hypothetical protein LQ343_000119 [Gyalolechia ehrenbergii]|nr:MAG: hypothetical protein LQ343_000119 [Gyalolechia ehrenbergii]
MATDPLETFTQLPLTIDPTSKSLSSSLPHLATPLTNLHTLQRTLLSLPSQIPPPPLPTNPKRSAQIQKMRDQGNVSLRKNPTKPTEAIQLYTYGIEMALGRPGWEPSQLVKEEASLLYANRAQAYMAAGMWPEGAADAESSVECKRSGNGKAWWRRGKCLVEMGRWKEAKEWVREGIEVEGEKEGELVALGKEIARHEEEEKRKEGR